MTLRAGLIGYGYAGRTFHAPLIAAVPGWQLAAICTSEPAKVQADWQARGAPAPAIEATPQALCARADVDVVVVATPNRLHHEHVALALAAGKHVVVDKPFTVTAAEARDLIARSAVARRILSVFHNRRWDADFLTLRALVAGGKLGRLVQFESHFDRYRPQVRARWRERAEPGGGLWHDLGPHLVDQALQLFGWPRAVHADLARQRGGAAIDDWFQVVLHYPAPADALRVILHAGALAAAPTPRFVVQGEQGGYVKHGLDVQEDQLKLFVQAPAAGLPADFGVDPRAGRLYLADADGSLAELDVPNQRGYYLGFFRGLASANTGTGPVPVDAADALRTMTVLEAGFESAAAGREVVLP